MLAEPFLFLNAAPRDLAGAAYTAGEHDDRDESTLLPKGRMNLVPVYRYRRLDILNDRYPYSQCWATREAIVLLGAELIEATMILVDVALLNSSGMTPRGVHPTGASLRP